MLTGDTAQDIERTVVAAIASLLTERGRLHDALKASEPGLAAETSAYVTAAEVAHALQSSEGHTHTSKITALIDRVTISDAGVEVTVSTQALATVARLGVDALSIPRVSKASDDPQPIRMTVKTQLKRCGKEMRLVLGDETARKPAPDNELIRAVARARLWHDQLVTGEARSIREICKRESLDERHLRRTLRLACLAPDIIEAIVAGRQPPELTARRLRDLDLPLRWDAQRVALGFR